MKSHRKFPKNHPYATECYIWNIPPDEICLYIQIFHLYQNVPTSASHLQNWKSLSLISNSSFRLTIMKLEPVWIMFYLAGDCPNLNHLSYTYNENVHYNDLPADIKNSQSISTFKRNLKKNIKDSTHSS